MGPAMEREQLEALETLSADQWAVALCLMAQGWHGDLHSRSVEDRSKLLQSLGAALIERAPQSVSPLFALGAIAAWTANKELPTSVTSSTRQVRLRALPLSRPDADRLVQRLLDALDPSDEAHQYEVAGFFKSWSAVADTAALEFYQLAKRHWEPKLLQVSKDSSQPPEDSLF
jgi:hypothetical protein